jgi:hypothetical protein
LKNGIARICKIIKHLWRNTARTPRHGSLKGCKWEMWF